MCNYKKYKNRQQLFGNYGYKKHLFFHYLKDEVLTTIGNYLSFIRHPINFFFCLKYPFWTLRNVWDGHFMGYSSTWYDSIPDGWKTAFGKQLSEDIKKAGKQTRKRLHKYVNWKNMITWEQIKEKYGTLRLYASCSEEIYNVLQKYEKMSEYYCIECGKPSKYMTKDWVEFYCEDCFNKWLDNNKFPIKEQKEIRKLCRIRRRK